MFSFSLDREASTEALSQVVPQVSESDDLDAVSYDRVLLPLAIVAAFFLLILLALVFVFWGISRSPQKVTPPNNPQEKV